MLYIMNYMDVFQDECVEARGASSADRRAGKGTGGVRDTRKFHIGRSWADIMEEEKRREEEKNQ